MIIQSKLDDGWPESVEEHSERYGIKMKIL